MRKPKRAWQSKTDYLKSDAYCSPYEGREAWESEQERLVTIIERSRPQATMLPTWNKGRGEQQLSLADLALTLWAVEKVGAEGLSYGQLARCFKDCKGTSCHRNKASALLSTLITWNIIAKVRNYSAGRRGNAYVVVGSDAHQKALERMEGTKGVSDSKKVSDTPNESRDEQEMNAADDDPWA